METLTKVGMGLVILESSNGAYTQGPTHLNEIFAQGLCVKVVTESACMSSSSDLYIRITTQNQVVVSLMQFRK